MKVIFTIWLSGLLSLGALGQNLTKLLPIKQHHLWGFINHTGKIVIEPQYETESYFDEFGYCSIKKNGFSGIIDSNNTVLVPFKYTHCYNIHRSIVVTQTGKSFGFINLTSGQYYNLLCESIEYIGNNRLKVLKSGAYGIISFDNQEILTTTYKPLSRIGNYFVGKEQSDKVNLFDNNGLLILKTALPKIRPLNDSLIYYKTENGWGLIDNQEKILIEDHYKGLQLAKWPLFEIKTQQDKIGLYNLEYDSLLIDTNYRTIRAIDSNFYNVVDFNNQSRIVTKTGKHINIQYQSIRPLDKYNCAILSSNNRWSFVKNNGDNIVSRSFDQISDIDNNLSIVVLNHKYGAYNVKTMKMVIPIEFQKLEQGLSSIKANDGNNTYLFSYNDKGTITDRSKFTNFESISIGPKPTFSPINFIQTTGVLNGQSSIDSSVLLNPLENGFVYYKKRYFLIDNKGRRQLPPYRTVSVFNNSPFALVSTQKKPISFDATVQRPHYGLVNYRKRRPVTNPSFWNIDQNNLIDNQFIIRAIAEGGRKCFIDRSGKIHYNVKIKYGNRYKTEQIGHIGRFRDGMAKINVDGYYNKRRSYSDRLNEIVVQSTKKWGYINSNGKVIIPPIFNRANDFNLGLAKVGVPYKKHIGYGLINTKHDTIVDFIYDQIDRLENSGDSLIKTTIKTLKKGVINSDGRVITEPLYDQINNFHNGYATVKISTKYGLIDTLGNVIIPTRYRKIGVMSKEGLIKVMTKNKWGYINAKGDALIKEQYSFAGNFVNGLAYVKVDGGYGYITSDGNIIIKAKFDKASDFHNGYAIVKKNGKYGIIDPSGAWVIPATNYYIYSVSKEGVIIYKSKKKGWYKAKTVDGQTIVKGEIRNKLVFNEGIARYKKGSRYGYVDTLGNLLSKPKYRYCGNFSEGLARVKKDGKWGYINTADTFVIAPRFSSCKDFSSGYAAVKIGDSLGLIDTKGVFKHFPNANGIDGFVNGYCIIYQYGPDITVDTNLKTLNISQKGTYYSFDHGYFRIFNGEKSFLVDPKGNVVLRAAFDHISTFHNGFATYTTGKLFGVYDLNGKELLATKYNYLQPIDQNLYEVHVGGKIGYLKKNGAWLWSPKN